MKSREPRRKVMIRARMRAGAVWIDVCILNISSRGLMIQAADPPPRGAFIEVRRGRHIIVAQVMWVLRQRFGLRCQDLLPIEAIIREPDSVGGDGSEPPVERRSLQREREVQHDRSRMKSRAMEFAFVAIFAISVSTMLLGMVHRALAGPLSTVTAALGRKG